MSQISETTTPKFDSRLTSEGCSVLLDINDADRLVFARLSASAKLKIGNKNCSLQPLIGCPYGSLFQVDSAPGGPYLSRIFPSSQGNDTEERRDSQLNVESRDNRTLIDNNKAQNLTGEDIEAMQRMGAKGDEIIEALIANSATFEKKTTFSQEKYRLRKQKKYAPKVLLRRPVARRFLRVDTLSLLLSMANVSSNSDILVVDMVGGLLTGALAERLGGTGFVCNSYLGSAPYSMDIVRIFNFSDEICKRIVRSPISDLLSQKESPEQILQRDDVCNMESQSNSQVCTSVSMDETSSSSGNGTSDLSAEGIETTIIPPVRACKSIKAGEKAQQETIDLWKENGFSSLVIAAPDLDTWTLVRDLLPLLSNSAPFAIYHQYLQPLATCMHNLQLGKMAIGMQISEPWLREYQLSQRYGIDSPKFQTSNIEVAPSLDKVVNLSSLEGGPGISGKHYGKSKVSRNVKSGIQRSNTGSPNSTPVNNCRYDSSLGLLTKKFVSLIQEAKDGTLDLNKTAEILEVQKRRIYDITNVLEGIGLIEKTSKNHIRWKGYDGLGPSELDDQVTRLKAEVETLYSEECQLNDLIRKTQELLRTLEEKENYPKYLFLTEEDVLSLPCFQNQTLIAIKAPPASYVEIPDPDEDNGFEQRQYTMIVRSTTGPIDLYLLSKHNPSYEDVSVRQASLKDPSRNSDHCGLKSAGLLLQGKGAQKNPFQNFSSLDREASGIQKITPTDFDIEDDYWFQSDHGVALTDLWANEPLVEIDELLQDNYPDEGGIITHTPASQTDVVNILPRVTLMLSSITVSFGGGFPFSFVEDDEDDAAASICMGSASAGADWLGVSTDGLDF
ncbi:tRNA (adenine(58)-N(1))-methyltransferase non-catalytic subunit trm6 [Senna tora]|uniref:tRNA (adenine(58)-N(1))-methyltransferase non-catalytic subunit TRM6 n=1 Tax=Senna tora TaxID=362788 RepID=A0A834WFQ0_9FABA|nr:tRNA (adenine(58)-N(1))-methyltransferase non-catalytic subunit trm6 [Senna tora]